MKAKYPGRCHECGESIALGDEIFWSRATGALHPECEEARGRPFTDVERVVFGVIPVEEASAETLAEIERRGAAVDTEYEEFMSHPENVRDLTRIRAAMDATSQVRRAARERRGLAGLDPDPRTF